MIKRFCKPFFAFLIVAMISASAEASDSDPELFPMENGKIIIQQNCEKGSRPVWDQAISKATGLKKGEMVLVITKDQLSPATLGDLTCFAEGCGGNYLSISLLTATRSDIEMLGAMKMADSKGLKGIPVQVVPAESECNAFFSQTKDDDLPEIKESRKCERISISGQSVLLLASQGFMQENGYPIYVSKVKVVSPVQKQQRADEFLEIDRDTDPLRPIFALTGHRGNSRLIWRKASGLCCPREVTVRLSWVEESGKISFGQAFKAGGQPCD